MPFVNRRSFVASAPVWLVGGRRRPAPTLLELMESSGNFVIWSSIVEEAGLAAMFRGPSPLTTFVPTDDAFGAGPDVRSKGGPGETPPQRKTRLAHLVLTHTLAGRHELPEILSAPQSLPTLGGGTMGFSSNGSSNLTVDWNSASASAGAAVTAAPLAASNGLLYPLWRIFVA